MKQILILHPGTGDERLPVSFLGSSLDLHRVGCDGDPGRCCALVAEHNGRVDAIGLEGMPVHLELKLARHTHALGSALATTTRRTPVVNSGGIHSGLKR